MSEMLQGADTGADAGPMAGAPPPVPGPSGFYGSRLRQLGLLHVDEPQAESFWREVSHHRRAILNRLGRDVGQRVALLDYLVNLQPHLLEPQHIEALAEGGTPNGICDALTGLHNRAYFALELQREVERALRYDVPVSLVLLDVDDFRVMDERVGRAATDEALQAIAAVVLHHVRAPDVPCRYGADEFALLLAHTPQVEAMAVAQRICSGVADWFARNLVGMRSLAVSLSAGVASLPMAESSVMALVREAEGALRDAKRMGGHRVVASMAGHRSPEVT